MAPRSCGQGAGRGRRACRLFRGGRGFRGRPLGDRCGGGGSGSRRGSGSGAFRPLPVAPKEQLLRQAAVGAQARVRRPSGDFAAMSPAAQPAGPCVLVIFGATGDLTKRLLFPAVYNLRRAGLLPPAFAIVGVARAEKDDEAFRDDLGASLRQFGEGEFNEEDWQWLRQRLFYVQGEFQDPPAYERLAKLLSKIDESYGTGGNYLFYLA